MIICLRNIFIFQHLLIWQKKLYETKDAKKNSELVEEIMNRLSNLKDETKEMSKEEIKNEKPNEILEIGNEIIDFNKKIQTGKGVKILTPDEMLSRLAITLAQSNAENNSENLKNEIKQLLYSSYRSTKLTENIYKNMINTIL